jgi:hypothetical protein
MTLTSPTMNAMSTAIRRATPVGSPWAWWYSWVNACSLPWASRYRFTGKASRKGIERENIVPIQEMTLTKPAFMAPG